MSYKKFIASKTRKMQPVGFEPASINPMLFDWQSSIVRWAVRRGRAAIFADCGLGKTPMQLAWAASICKQTGRRGIAAEANAIVLSSTPLPPQSRFKSMWESIWR